MADKTISIKVEDANFKKNLEKAKEGIPEVVQKVFEDNAQIIYENSQPLVPVLTGRLRDSGEVLTKDPEGREEMYASISYGGGLVDYAVKVHEDLQMHHPHGGQAKFLEIPFEEQVPEITSQLSEAINQFLGRL